MAGSDDDSRDAQANHRQSLQNEHDRLLRELRDEQRSMSTPFAAFKRFIDDNLHTFTDNFRNFPSNLAELRSNMQEEQLRREEEEREISRRWTGSSASPDHIQMHVNRLPQDEKKHWSQCTRSFLADSARRNAHVPLSKITALYADWEAGTGLLDQLASPLLALGGTWYYMPETGDTLPTAPNWSLLGSTARWLSVDWFKRNPYSPIRLEAHPDPNVRDLPWRHAFEDLMLAALDKPLPTEPDRLVDDDMPGIQWMLGLQYTGILPPLLPSLYSGRHTRQNLDHMSILDIISKCDAPWGNERSLPWQDSLSREFSELRFELAAGDTLEWDDFDARIAPLSELDLYEQHLPSQHGKDHDMLAHTLKAAYEKKLLGLMDKMAANSDDYDGVDDDVDEYDDHDDDVDDDDDDDDDSCPIANEHRQRAWNNHYQQQVREAANFMLTGDKYNAHELNGTEVVGEKDKWRSQMYWRLADVLLCTGKLNVSDVVEYAALQDHDLEDAVIALEQQRDALELERKSVGREDIEEQYERRMAQARAQEQRHAEQYPEPVAKEEKSDVVEITGKRPDILSALTTTQTTRLPDGTVTTKIVLKKRFADGREETSESVHTTNEIVEERMRREREEEQQKSGRRKGWFWS